VTQRAAVFKFDARKNLPRCELNHLPRAADDDFGSGRNHSSGRGRLLARGPAAGDLHFKARAARLLNHLAHRQPKSDGTRSCAALATTTVFEAGREAGCAGASVGTVGELPACAPVFWRLGELAVGTAPGAGCGICGSLRSRLTRSGSSLGKSLAAS